MTEKKESARATVILALVALAIGVYALSYGLQTMFYFQARYWASQAPFLREVPQQLPSTAASPAQGKSFSFYEMSFAAPWKGTAVQTNGDAHSEVDFDAGPIIIFFNPQGEKDILSSVRDGDPDTYHGYQAVFGANLFPTNYDLYMAVYSASPASLSPFMSREEVVRVGTLLEWKLAFAASGASAVYTVQTPGLRGFQFGDASRDPMVVVRLFDTHNAQFRLLFTSKSGPGTFPQSDINCVLDSLQPVARGQ
ncbi:MAG: hypothetical protein WAN33_11590 [Candidatus Acidiferrales bacterium]